MRVLLVALASLALAAQPSPQSQWVKANAIPIADADVASDFRDLEPLKALIGNARIVALGEATHGTHEFFAMKRRLTEFLAREMGFTLFAMEGNMPESRLIGEYVRTGEGDPATLVKGLTFWTWTTEELTDLLRWMRSYRAAGGSMDFSGVDIQLPAAAQRYVVEFLRREDPALAATADATYQRLTPAERQFGLAYVELPAQPFAGKQITLTGWVKGTAVSGYAGLHLRANDTKGEPLQRATTPVAAAVTGTREWTELTVSLAVPENAVTVRVGGVLFGRGDAWFDALRIEGGATPVSLGLNPGEAASVTLDERSKAMPFRSALDTTVKREGTGSVHVNWTGGAAYTPADAVAAANSVLVAMEAARSRYQGDVDWALQHARFVRQSFEWRADPTLRSREVSMAVNLKWLLDRMPPATKVVVWAHNGHIRRHNDALGGVLAEMFPGQMVNIGFTTSTGSYHAEGPGGEIRVFPLQPPIEGSVEEQFDATGVPRFMLDLRPARTGGPERTWLNERRPYRFIGTVGGDRQFTMGPLASLFDIVIHLRDTRPSTLLR